MEKTLTNEEKRVLILLGEGKTGKQISMALDISERRMREIKKSFNAKLGARNHTHAVYLFAKTTLFMI